MGLLKFIAVGAAIGYGINYLTKKDASGRSVLDDITDEASVWAEKAKRFAEEKTEQVITAAQPNGGYTEPQ